METTSNEAWKRIETVIEISGARNVNAFANLIGLQRPELLYRIQRGENGISKALARRIHEHFPLFNTVWLSYGGENAPSYLKFHVNNRLVMIPFYEDTDVVNTDHYIYLPDDLTNGAEMALVAKEKSFSNYPHSCSILLLKKAENCNDYTKIYLVRSNDINGLCEIRPAPRGKVTVTPIGDNAAEGIVTDVDSIGKLYEICGIFIK